MTAMTRMPHTFRRIVNFLQYATTSHSAAIGGILWQLWFILLLCNCIVSAFEPDFVFPLENVTIAQGRDATFTCVVNNLGGHRVSGGGDSTQARVLGNPDNAMAHSKDRENVGENLGTSTGTVEKALKKAVQLWYDEHKLYKKHTEKMDPKTGHFTALVWKASTHLGCGQATRKTDKERIVIVAHYKPQGNINGQYADNVVILDKAVTIQKPVILLAVGVYVATR